MKKAVEAGTPDAPARRNDSREEASAKRQRALVLARCREV